MSCTTAWFYFPNVDMYGNKSGPGKHTEILYIDSSLNCSTIGKQDAPNITLDSILFHDFHQRNSIFKRIEVWVWFKSVSLDAISDHTGIVQVLS